MKLRNFSISSLVAGAAFLGLAAVPAFAETVPTQLIAAAPVVNHQPLLASRTNQDLFPTSNRSRQAQTAPASTSSKCKCCADMMKKMEGNMGTMPGMQHP